jgi:hypothetical protein
MEIKGHDMKQICWHSKHAMLWLSWASLFLLKIYILNFLATHILLNLHHARITHKMNGYWFLCWHDACRIVSWILVAIAIHLYVSWILVLIAIHFYVSWIRQEFNKNSQQIASNSSSRIVDKSTKFLNLSPRIRVVSWMTQEAC